MKSKLFLLLFLTLTLNGCDKDDETIIDDIQNPIEINFGGSSSGDFGEIIYQNHTVVLDEELKTNLVEVNQNYLIFNYSNSFSQLAVGDVIFSSETELAAGGFARKIVSIENNDVNYKFITSQAKAEDVFEKVDYTEALELDFENIRNLNGINNPNLKNNIVPVIEYNVENERVDITLKYDLDNDLTSTTNQLKLSCFVEITNTVPPFLVFAYDATNSSNNVFSLNGLIDISVGGEISYGGKTSSEFVEDDFINADLDPLLEIDRSFEIVAIPLSGLISPSDLVVKPEIVIFATFKVSITGKVYVEFSKDFRYNYNILYQGSTTGNGWDNSFEELLDDDWSFGYGATAEIEFEATPLAVGPVIKFPQFLLQGNNQSFVGLFIYPWTQKVTASVDYNSSTQCFETDIVQQNKWKATFESKISALFSNNQIIDIDIDLYSQSYVTDQTFSIPDFCFFDESTTDVITTDISEITETSATSGGNVTDDGGNAVTVKGICYSTTPNPTTTENTSNDGTGTGAFTSNINGLTANTTYYVKAYATNSEGTAYGNEISFTTLNTSSTTEPAYNPIPNDNSTNTSLNGNLSFTEGNNTPTDATFKVYFDTNSNPNTAFNLDANVNTLNYSNLLEATLYYWKVETLSNSGSVLTTSPLWSFTTIADNNLATVTSNPILNITQNSATSGGNVTDDGGNAVTVKGICYSTTPNPTTADITSNDGTGTGAFTSNITGLTANTTYYVKAYATNSEGTAYGNEISFTTLNSSSTTEPAYNPIPNDNSTNISLNGNLSFTEGNNTPTDATFKVYFDTSSNPNTVFNLDANVNTLNYSNLQEATPYYWKVETISNTGNVLAISPIWSFTTATNSGGTAVVDVLNPITGKTWMDRNLGASQAATSITDAAAYGDLYQWGRAADGHEKRNSGITSTLSSTDNPGHGDFITTSSSPRDWRSPQNNNLWQGVNGTNNPCPSGYRLPTDTELLAERDSWSSNNSAGAFASPLKFPVAGHRLNSFGSLEESSGFYWSSSTVSGTRARGLFFINSAAGLNMGNRAYGLSVRCLKD